MKLDLEKFNPTVAELKTIADNASKVIVTDLKDKDQLKKASDERKGLKEIRISLTKTGKELRSEATKFSKAVITKEKELIALIEPEELRLKAYEDEAKELEIMEKRIAKLPVRKKELEEIGDGLLTIDNYLLKMSDIEYGTYYNGRVSAKNKADADKLAADQAKLDEEKRVAAIKEQARIDAKAMPKEEEDEKVVGEFEEVATFVDPLDPPTTKHCATCTCK